MNCPGFVRAVALLMLLVGLQAGSFRDLTASEERYYGAPDHSVAARPEVRQPDALPLPGPSAQPPRPEYRATVELPPPPKPDRAGAFPRHHPDPTGPPRA